MSEKRKHHDDSSKPKKSKHKRTSDSVTDELVADLEKPNMDKIMSEWDTEPRTPQKTPESKIQVSTDELIVPPTPIVIQDDSKILVDHSFKKEIPKDESKNSRINKDDVESIMDSSRNKKDEFKMFVDPFDETNDGYKKGENGTHDYHELTLDEISKHAIALSEECRLELRQNIAKGTKWRNKIDFAVLTKISRYYEIAATCINIGNLIEQDKMNSIILNNELEALKKLGFDDSILFSSLRLRYGEPKSVVSNHRPSSKSFYRT